jgi:hypothetical protein
MSTKKKKPLSLTVKRPAVVSPVAVVAAAPEKETTEGPSTAQDSPDGAQTPPAAAPIPPVNNKPYPEPTEPDETEETDDPYYATREILDYAFKTWAGSFMAPMMYFMTRTFAHHRRGEKYDTGLVFNQLMQISGGNHQALLDDIRAYGETLQAELETFLAAREAKD